jgi:phage terminase large subunit-like protein
MTEQEHEHKWKFEYTNDNWFDGDETDIYSCEVEGCTERKRVYIPR